MIDLGQEQIPLEIKSGQTLSGDFFAGLEYWRKLVSDPEAPAALVWGGDRALRRRGVAVYPWYGL